LPLSHGPVFIVGFYFNRLKPILHELQANRKFVAAANMKRLISKSRLAVARNLQLQLATNVM